MQSYDSSNDLISILKKDFDDPPTITIYSVNFRLTVLDTSKNCNSVSVITLVVPASIINQHLGHEPI
jgi:hypothetical protein